MKESLARTKLCPHQYAGAMTVQMTILSVSEKVAEENFKDLKTISDAADAKCAGSGCMMWEAEFRREELFISENEDPPESDQTWRKGRLDKPSGQQQWFRWNPGPDGTCGLITKECEH